MVWCRVSNDTGPTFACTHAQLSLNGLIACRTCVRMHLSGLDCSNRKPHHPTGPTHPTSGPRGPESGPPGPGNPLACRNLFWCIRTTLPDRRCIILRVILCSRVIYSLGDHTLRCMCALVVATGTCATVDVVNGRANLPNRCLTLDDCGTDAIELVAAVERQAALQETKPQVVGDLRGLISLACATHLHDSLYTLVLIDFDSLTPVDGCCGPGACSICDLLVCFRIPWYR